MPTTPRPLGTPPAQRLGGRTFWLGVEGGALAVETTGIGPTIVLLHGWTLDRRMWAMQTGLLGAHFRFVAIDRRGFGQSSAPPDLFAEVEDLKHLVDALDLDDFTLVGMSQAGSIAIRYAQQRGSPLKSLVLQGVSLAGVAEETDRAERIPLLDYMTLARNGQLTEMKRQWAAHPLMQGLSGAAAAQASLMLADYDGRDLCVKHPAPLAGINDLRDLTLPVLAITGAEDTAWRRAVTSAIGVTAVMGTTVFVPRAGHLCNLTHPHDFNTFLLQYLQKL